MKKLLFFTLLTSLNCFAQDVILPKDSVTGKMTYTDVVKIDSSKANELYSKAKMWIAEAFKSAKDVMQLDDKDNSTLIAKGLTIWNGKALGSTSQIGYVHFTIKIECKEGRYKYTFTDYTCEQTEGYRATVPAEGLNGRKAQINFTYQQIQDFTTAMIADLKTTMNKSLTTKSDW
jgi:hypothetical protein